MANFGELKHQIKTWSNDQEDLLIRKIRLFSENFNKKAEEINITIKDIDEDINKAEISYFNNLNLLKNMSIRKYVEHTISNEILDFKKQRSDIQQPKPILSKEEKEHNLIEKFKLAIGISCENLNIKDLLDVKDDRDNNDDDNASVVTGSKYFQNMTKPSKVGVKLPLIIGQEAFFNKPYCGVVLEDLEMNTDKEVKILPEKQNIDNVGREIKHIPDEDRDRGKSFMSQIPNIPNQKISERRDVRENEKELEFDSEMNHNDIVLKGDYNNMNAYSNTTNLPMYNNNTNNNANSNTSNIPNIPIPNMGKLPTIKDIGVPKVVINVNKNAKVPTVPKIAIPIPKPKPKIESEVNKVDQPEIVQEEVKPAKTDFRSELFKRLNTMNQGGKSEMGNNALNNNEDGVNSARIENNPADVVVQSNQPKKPISQPVVIKPNNQFKHSSTLNTGVVKQPLSLLDDDDEEDGLFSGVKLPNKTNTKNILLDNKQVKKGIFDEIKEEEDEDIDRDSAVSIKKKDKPQEKVNEFKPQVNPIVQTNQLNKKEKLIKEEIKEEVNTKQNNLQSKFKIYFFKLKF